MTWLTKLSQNINLKQQFYDLSMSQFKLIENKKKELNQKETSWVDVLNHDYEIKVYQKQLNQNLIGWTKQHWNQIQQEDSKTIQYFQSNLDNLIQKNNEPFKPPTQENFDYLDNDAVEYYLNHDHSLNEHLISLLDKQSSEYDLYAIYTFPTGKKVTTIMLNDDPVEWYVIEQDKKGIHWTQDANQWVDDAFDRSFEYYPEENKNFWDDIGPGNIVYHATDDENTQSILKKGLQISSKTRGLSNQYTPSAIFASYSTEAINAYGNSIFAIDLYAMKKDGYMPDVSQEEPVDEAQLKQALAYGIGMEEYDIEEEPGVDHDTIVIYGNIPPKYLKLIN